MGSSKKHKKHKSERRDKYEEYSNNMDPAHLQRGLKLILKVGSNSTPEYNGNCTPVTGPPTAAEAMMAAAPSSPILSDEVPEEEYRERHKKSKKKKKKKDREKKHKHHKEKRHRHRDGSSERHREKEESIPIEKAIPTHVVEHYSSPKAIASISAPAVDGDSSQDGFNFMDEDPMPENMRFYATITTDNSPSCRPVSKPIIPIKDDNVVLETPSTLHYSSLLGVVGDISPTKPLPDLLIPSPSASNAGSTPGGTGSLAALTPKTLDAPKTPSSSSESGREPRSCVLKLKQQKSPLNKVLDHLMRFLEKRDPHQFFAWPVTDDIAPGYSSIITKPMDFSTMRQKIDDNEYSTLLEFTDDFKLMCDNAIRYNHVDTVYHKAAKRLAQVGSKHLMQDSVIRILKTLPSYTRELTSKDLGFEIVHGDFGTYDQHGMGDSADEGASTGADEPTPAQLEEGEKRRAIRAENEPKTHFEPFVDDLTAEEILAQVQGAARAVKKRLSLKEKAHKMGFLRQNKDGTTSLNLLIKDVNEGPEKVVCLGDLVGKLESGTGQLSGLREQKRHETKGVKNLNYGPFTSFAPVLDTRFSNLSKEETQLIISTYGDSTSSEYAESILQFTKDSSYASMLANNLLDILTNGEHSKTMSELYNMQMQNHEEEESNKYFNEVEKDSREQIEADYEKYKNTRIDFNKLRNLNDLGIDIGFLDSMETEMKNFELSRRLQEHLSNNLNLIQKLRTTQNERLSQPLPQHLGNVQQPGQDELQLAHQITQQLSDCAKKLPPAALTDAYSLRKAMGMSYVGLPPPPQPSQRMPVPELLQQSVTLPPIHIPTNLTEEAAAITIPDDDSNNGNVSGTLPMDIDDDVAVLSSSSGVDLENELREFLESGSGLHSGTAADDNSIVAQLLLN